MDGEAGLFVYRACVRVAVRNRPDTGDQYKVELQFEEGDLVAVDLRRAGRGSDESKDWFLRLADADGWLFENKQGVRCMTNIPVESGLWSYRVDNPVGLQLRRHPSTRGDLVLEQIFSRESIVWGDRMVKSGDSIFLRVQGTEGWLFTRRNGQQTMTPVDSTAAVVSAPLVSPSSQVGSKSKPAVLPVVKVRQLAAKHRLSEIMVNEASRVVSFSCQLGDGSRWRLNVYYSTGTIGTCLEHPRLGKTQLFRRGCTLAVLEEIMANPRVHTQRGYHKRRRAEEILPCGTGPGGEGALPLEATLRLELAQLDDEVAHLMKKRATVLDLLRDGVEEKHREALEAAARVARAAEAQREAAAAEQQAKAEERERQAVLREASLRGKAATWVLQHPYHDSLDMDVVVSASCIALGKGYCTLRQSEGPTWHGLPTSLYNILNGRQKSLPPAEYVSISDERYYVRFANNSSQRWLSFDEAFDAAVNHPHKTVDKVAFGNNTGEDYDDTDDEDYCFYSQYWFILYTDGSATWHPDIPRELANLIHSISTPIRDVTMGLAGQWFIVWQGMKWQGGGFCPQLSETIHELEDAGNRIRKVLFGDVEYSWLIRFS